MKRAPVAGEPKVIHFTTNTEHRAEFAFGEGNFQPQAVVTAGRMMATGEAVAGFRLERSGSTFLVYAKSKEPITRNSVSIHGLDVELQTTVLGAAAKERRETMEMAADLEQCAAVAIALEDPRIEKWATLKVQ